MTAKNHVGMHSAAPHKHASSTEKFLRDTAKTLERLHEALSNVSGRRHILESQIETFQSNYTASMGRAINKTLPDLLPTTISRLGVAVPGFLNTQLRAEIQAARFPRVPFFTSLFGRSDKYIEDSVSNGLASLKIRLRRHVEGLDAMPAGFEQAASSSKALTKAKSDYNTALAREQALKEQIAGLERIQAAFADGTRPVPPTLAAAVANSATQNTTSSGSSGSVHEFDYVNDILIPQMVWNSIFDHRSDHYYDRPYSSPSESWGSDANSNSQRHETPANEGNASVTMGDAAPAEEGNASVRMSDSTPAEEGNASARMGSDPVIVDPDIGETRVSMSVGNHEDRTESGAGTKY